MSRARALRLGVAVTYALALAGCAVGVSNPGSSHDAGDRGSTTATPAPDPGGTAGGGSGTAGEGPGTTTAGQTTAGGTTAGQTTGGGNTPWPLDALRLVGRFVDDGTAAGGRKFAWSGSTVLARFDGTGAMLTLDEPTAKDAPLGNYYDVSVDGRTPSLLKASAGQHDYVLAQNLVAGTPHQLSVRRRTEARVGGSRLVAMAVTGGTWLPPPPASDRRIWAIGDSITAGYGAEGATSTCAYSPATENANRTAAAVAADSFGAELQITAWAGKGVWRNEFGDMADLMPQLAFRALPSDPTSGYDPGRFAPQVVVINLGTNDYALGNPPEAAFAQAYTALLRAVRASCPDAVVLCAIGPMLSDADPAGQMALSNARAAIGGAVAAFGDAKVLTLEFPELTTDQMGCAGHPNVGAQASMGQLLAGRIAQLTGWATVAP